MPPKITLELELPGINEERKTDGTIDKKHEKATDNTKYLLVDFSGLDYKAPPDFFKKFDDLLLLLQSEYKSTKLVVDIVLSKNLKI